MNPPLAAPVLFPDLPNYPVHIQVCRVTAATVPGPTGYGSSAAGQNLYVSFTTQFQPTSLLPRDREPCLVLDCNGQGLAPGFYVARLVGSYTSLPVYEVGGASIGGSSGSVVVTQTTNTFIIPGPPVSAGGGSSASPGGTVSINVLTTSKLSVGEQIEITDGTSTVVGYVSSITNNNTFLFQTLQIMNGKAGDTMLAGALIFLCCPIGFASSTYSPFTIPAFNAQVTVQVTKTTWMIPGMGVVVTDGIKTLFGVIDSISPSSNPPTVTLNGTRVDSGNVGDQMSSLATIMPAPTSLTTQTTASFTIPSPGNAVTVSVTSTGWMQTGQEYLISDGTNFVYGFAVPTANDAVTFYPTLTTGGGGTGNTMSRRATMTPMKSPENVSTTIGFTAPTVGGNGVTVNVQTTDQYKNNDTVTISDGNGNVIFGWVTVNSKTSLTFNAIYYFGGSAGSAVSTRAIVKKCCVSVNPLLGKPFPPKTQTTGFSWFNAMWGIPTGTPNPLFGGYAPFVPDMSNPSLWTFVSSNWVSPTAGVLGSTIASAATVDLSTVSGDFITITGNTGPITSFGTMTGGIRRTLKFASNPVITYAPANIVLPNGVSITAAAGDTMELVSEGGGTWKCKNYTRASNGIIVAADGATVTFDMSLGDTSRPSGKFKVTLGGNRTLAVTNFVDGSVLYLELVQDGTGSRTVTWFSNILWSGGTVPTLTTTANKRDVFILVYDAASSRWLDGGNKLNL